MPTYSMKNTETDEIYEIFMTVSEREVYLRDNPHIQQLITRATPVLDSVRLGIRKPDRSFNDVLLKAKKAHLHSTIDTR